MDDSASMAAENALRAPISEVVSANLDSLDKSAATDEERVLLGRVGKVRPVYRECVERIVALAKANKDDEATAILFGEMSTAQGAYIEALAELAEHEEAMARKDGMEAEDLARRSSIVLGLLAIAALFVGLLASWTISGGIRRSLQRCVDVARDVASGKTDVAIVVDSRDETGTLLGAMKEMTEAIQRMGIDTAMLSDAAVEGRLGVRADASRHQGDFRKIVQGVNETLDSLVGFLDNMPNPCMTIDREFRVLYMNKAGAALGGTTGERLARERRKCSEFFKTGDCGSERCACDRAMRANAEASGKTEARPLDKSLDIQYSGVPIRDRQGQVIGALRGGPEGRDLHGRSIAAGVLSSRQGMVPLGAGGS